MVKTQPNPALQQALAQASQLLRAGDAGGAIGVLAPLLDRFPAEPRLLHLAGTAQMHQQNFGEAADLFARARAANPREAVLAFSHGTALQWLERHAEAAQAFTEATRLKPDYAESYYEAGTSLKRLGRFDAAAEIFRAWSRALPDDVRARLALGGAVLDAGRNLEAEKIFSRALLEPSPPVVKGALHHNHALALRRQDKNEAALAQFALARSEGLEVAGNDALRAEILHDLKRYDEALEISRQAIARDPANPDWHKLHNELLYRLGREDYLKSFDAAPQTAPLLLSKAFFLNHENRAEEALETFSRAAALDPGDRLAAAGVANSLARLGRHGEAIASFDTMLALHGDDAGLLGCAAEAALLSGDPEKTAALCERALALSPYDQIALSTLGTAWRLMADARDETLNGYDTLIQSFELEPPAGFSSMEDFNAELNAWLDRVHPATREYLGQSLRGGTQTPDQIFGKGHELVEKLRGRIGEAVARYIAGLKEDDQHPFLSRRTKDFGYAGSWSSRLRDCGFHVNHIHPDGWISSCYYVAVPKAVEDEKERQGWIKFGEPLFDVALKDRRAIQPRAGRLVLFPSYMWHGTVPFQDAQPRTTIAFDVIPKG
jgi:tetratricopeptide (TPR) repeat protein